MDKNFRRFVALLLVFAMIIGVLPNKAHAAEEVKYTSDGHEAGTNFVADNAFDGDLNTRWASKAELASEADPRWIQVEYPEAKEANVFNIYWERNNVNDFQLLGSNDGNEYEEIFTSESERDIEEYPSAENHDMYKERIELEDSVSFKFYKINVTSFDSNSYSPSKGQDIAWPTISIFEFELLNVREAYVGEKGENLLLNKEATASNEEAGTEYTADKAVDGDIKTHWATDKDDSVATRTLTVNLERLTAIDAFALYPERTGEEANITAYNIEISEDGEEYQKIYEVDNKNSDKRHVINLSDRVYATHVRLNITGYDGGILDWKNVGIFEFEAYSHYIETSPSVIRRLSEIDILLPNDDGTEVFLPEVVDGTIKIIGSNKDQVVNTDGKIYKPLTDTEVKITVELEAGDRIETKELPIEIPGIYEDEGINKAPNVIPTVQQWHGREGNTEIDSNTSLVYDEAFSKAIIEFKADLMAKGIELNDGESENVIEYKKVTDKGYGEEGYYIDINNGKITVEAETNTGALYASRTLLQAGSTIPNGEIKDFPKYDLRGFMIDTGRSFIPLRTMYDILENMAYFKMNDLHVHLNDNYIWMHEHSETDTDLVLERAEAGFRIESDIVGENGKKLTSDDHYTREEFRALVQRAKDLGINVVPEFDVPAHSLAFIRVRPDLMYKGSVGGHKHTERTAMFDLENPESLEFIKSVFNEQMDGEDPSFEGLDVIHFGADEYYGTNEEYRKFVDDMIKYLRDEKGVTPRVWGSLNAKTGTTPIDGTGAQMNIWNVGWNNPHKALEYDFDIINITDGPMYIVPNGGGNRGGYGDFLNLNAVYNWNPNVFDKSNVVDESNPKLLGGSFAIWQDNIDFKDKGITSYDVFIRFYDALPVVAERAWNSDRMEKTYSEFDERLTSLQEETPFAPRTNPFYKHNFEELDIEENYELDNVEKKVDHISFKGDGKLVSDLDDLGPDYVIDLEVSLSDVDSPQVLFTNGDYTFYLVDEDGNVSYNFERYNIKYDIKLEKDKIYKIKIVGENQSTELYIDGNKVGRMKEERHPNIAYNSLIMPLKEIGTNARFDLYSLSIRNETYVDDSKLEVENATASSEEIDNATDKEGPIELAFDGDPDTIWHSVWNGGKFPFTVEIDMGEAQEIGSFGYLPRSSGINGIVTEYELFVSEDGEDYELFDSGTWDLDHNEKIIDLDGKMVKNFRFVIHDAGSNSDGIFASAAEFNIRKVVEDLEMKKLDLSELIEKVNEVEELNKEDYSNFEILEEPLMDAKELLDYYENALDTDANRLKVKEVLDSLVKAINGLEDKPIVEDKEGWIKEGNDWYYYIDGKKVVDKWISVEVEVDGKTKKNWKYFNKAGKNQTTFYADGNGVWLSQIGPDKEYYRGWWENEVGMTYYFRESSGSRVSDWQYIEGSWRYFRPSGTMVRGWQYVDGGWRYFNEDGKLLVDKWAWVEVDSDGDGKYDKHNWKYFNKDGKSQTTFYKDGDKVWLSQSGPNKEYLRGWWTNEAGMTYYFRESSGSRVTGWQYIDGSWRYFRTSGTMVTGRQYIEGKWHNFDKAGKLIGKR